jgi:Tfp pilus assembly protein PilX
MNEILKRDKGITLIELLVAFAISGLLVAGVYRTFMSQQKTYVIQEQVVDMQQNMRIAINRMMTEIRMAGFGNVSMVLPVTYTTGTFNNVLNLNTPTAGSLTIVSADGGSSSLTALGGIGGTQIVVSTLTDSQGNALFDTGNRKYISVGGLESHMITSIDSGTKTITLDGPLSFSHSIGTPVYTIRALSYQVASVNGISTLLRNENMGNGAQPQVDSIENLQFTYLDVNGNPTANPLDIRIIRVSLTAITERQDPDLKNGDGYRRRQIVSNIHLRNMGIDQWEGEKQMEPSVLKNEKGVVLVIALIMLIILTLIGISSISSSVFEAKISGNERFGSASFYAASGGVQVGISRLPEITAYSGNIGSDESYRSGRLADSSPQLQKNLGVICKPGFETTWEFKRFQINATGESFGAKKEIEVQVSLGPYTAGTSYNNWWPWKWG